MFCIKCGNKLNEETKFCKNCGNAVNTGKNENSSKEESTENDVPPFHEYLHNMNNHNEPSTLEHINISATTIWQVVTAVASGVLSIIIIILGIVFVNNILTSDYIGDIIEDIGRNSTTTARANFEWVEEPTMRIFYGIGSIEGSIKNISNTTFSIVTIEFILYDSSGNQIDTAIDIINNFRAGNTWKFNAMILGDIASFEFVGVSAY
jgi:hypothetical protein